MVGNSYVTNLPSTGLDVLYPNYFGMQLASKFDGAGAQVVQATSSSGPLNVYAVKEANGDLDLMVINTSATAATTDQFSVSGFNLGGSATVWQYGETQDTAQEHSKTGASALAESTAKLSVSGGNFSYSFPAYSMTVLDIPASAPFITVAPSGSTNTFTIGSSAVAVDSGVTVSSNIADLTGAIVTISTGYSNGDLLHFTSQNGITGTYSNGVLTLSGTATPAQYQTALESITFSTTSTSTTARKISIVALDSGLSSTAATETVDVLAKKTSRR